MEWIILHYQDLLAIAGAVVLVASLIVKLTPSTRDDEIVGKIMLFLESFSVVSKKTKL